MRKKVIYFLLIFFGLTYPMCEKPDTRTEAEGAKVANTLSLFKRKKQINFLKEFKRKEYKQAPVSAVSLFNHTLNDLGVDIFPIESPKEIYEVIVKLKSKKMTENNHVGNDWEYNFKVGETLIEMEEEYSLLVYPNQYFEISSIIIEKDEYDDWGVDVLKIDYAELEEGYYRLIKEISVTEDRGRYAGNSAYFDVKYEIMVSVFN